MHLSYNKFQKNNFEVVFGVFQPRVHRPPHNRVFLGGNRYMTKKAHLGLSIKTMQGCSLWRNIMNWTTNITYFSDLVPIPISKLEEMTTRKKSEVQIRVVEHDKLLSFSKCSRRFLFQANIRALESFR